MNRFPESYDEEDKRHSLWWSDEMQRAKSVINEVQNEIAKNEEVSIAGSYTCVNKNGEHELRISFTLHGEAFSDYSLNSGRGENQ